MDSLAFNIEGMTESQKFLSLRTWVSTVRPGKPATEKQYGEMSLETEKTERPWVPRQALQSPHPFGSVVCDENHWNAIHHDPAEQTKEKLEMLKDIDQMEHNP